MAATGALGEKNEGVGWALLKMIVVMSKNNQERKILNIIYCLLYRIAFASCWVWSLRNQSFPLMNPSPS